MWLGAGLFWVGFIGWAVVTNWREQKAHDRWERDGTPDRCRF
jgi:hypothetical protein